jgi:hypothetical protein
MNRSVAVLSNKGKKDITNIKGNSPFTFPDPWGQEA